MSYILKFPSKARSLCFNEKCKLLTVVVEENYNNLLWLWIFLNSDSVNPGIPFLLSCMSCDGHIIEKFRTETIDECKIEETNIMILFLILVLIKTGSFYYVFSFLTIFVYICKQCESCAMNQIYWSQEIVFIHIEKEMISRDQMSSCDIKCQFI